jgi:hypothetical protein
MNDELFMNDCLFDDTNNSSLFDVVVGVSLNEVSEEGDVSSDTFLYGVCTVQPLTSEQAVCKMTEMVDTKTRILCRGARDGIQVLNPYTGETVWLHTFMIRQNNMVIAVVPALPRSEREE